MFSNHVKKSFFGLLHIIKLLLTRRISTHKLTQTHTYTYTYTKKKFHTRLHIRSYLYIEKYIFSYIYIRKYICSNFKYKIRDLFLKIFFILVRFLHFI